jgi:hypothetical protein
MEDEGKDVTRHLVLSKARRPGHEQRRVNVDFPSWIIESLDAQASRLGVTRQSVIKLWIAERLKEEMKKNRLTARAAFVLFWTVDHSFERAR